jgi:phytoene desaturase
MNKKTAVIIGSGFGSLGAAAILAKAGWEVEVYEKNEQLGGRASTFAAEGFKFDMGPSWYLMPDVFEHFYDILGEKVSDHLKLKKLAPSYRIFYKDSDQSVDIYSDLKRDLPTFEAIEAGAAESLKEYLSRAEYQYSIAKDKFMYKNYDSLLDFFTKEVMTEGRKLSVFKNMDKYVKGYFSTDKIQKIMQYPLVFLGSSPYNTPAIYNIMSHIDFAMGVFYPEGGLNEIVQSLVKIGKKHGVKYYTDSPVAKITTKDAQATGIKLQSGKIISADIVISGADTRHTEQALLEPEHRDHSEKYWQSRTLAPSALIMYLGVKGKIPELTHHNLLFSKDWKKNFADIFDHPAWPEDPSLYICAPSITDKNVAPKDHENLFVLVPIAPRMDYTQEQLDKYADKVLLLIESELKIKDFGKRIVYKKLFCSKEFTERYNSYGGSALGLAHTLKQTAVFRPNNVSKKVSNLYYVGAGTNPGIGMPTSLISSELMYKRIIGEKTTGPLGRI